MNFQFGSANVVLSGGIAIDGSGNIGTYYLAGGGAGLGARVSGGLSVNASNAKTICDLSGPFVGGSFGGGWGPAASGDYFTGPSNNGWVYGAGLTLGKGLGLGGASQITNTIVNPIAKLW
jgi:hypothetical protein